MIERVTICDPDAAISAGHKTDGCVRSQALSRRKCGDARIAETVDSVRCRSPDNPFFVFKEMVNGIAGQAFRPAVMLHSIASYSKQSVAYGPHPEATVAIESQGLDREFAAIESRRDE